MSMLYGWLGLTFLGGLANAGVVVLWKHMASRPDILAIVALNSLISGVLILAYMGLFLKIRPVLDAPFWQVAVGMGLLSAVIIICFSVALASGPVSYVNPIFGGVLNVTVVVLGVLLFAEKLTLLSTIGIMAVIVGVICIAMGG